MYFPMMAVSPSAAPKSSLPQLKVTAWSRWLVQNHGFNKEEPNKILDFFIFGVTIIVVAVPEGLPLAVTISLAYRYGPASAGLRPKTSES